MPDLTMDDEANLSKRRAIEALRNGVPNSDAVRALGCGQPEAEKRFQALLASVAAGSDAAKKSAGMLVSGEFGSGKSHLLAHLEHIALSEGFVCSRVAISKETPLHDLNKVLHAAVDKAIVPGRKGRLIDELDLLSKRHSERYGEFYGWVFNETENRDSLHGIFLASLIAYMDSQDFDLKSRIEGFWAGDRIAVSQIKAGLREIGKRQFTGFRIPRAADLPPQRLRFLIELIKGVGYKGWVVLLDELELLASFSILQRGRSYAELARWLRHARVPGLLAVGAVTLEFAELVISPQGRKQDWDKVPLRLLSRPRDEPIVDSAQYGMRQLQEACLPLRQPTDEEVQSAIDVLRQLYSEAYGWSAPELSARTGGVGLQNRMRYKIRAAINEWDLLRLVPGAEPETQIEAYEPAYEEQPGFEPSSRGDDDEPWMRIGRLPD